MSKCRNCNTENEDNAVFCRNCGQRIEIEPVEQDIDIETNVSDVTNNVDNNNSVLIPTIISIAAVVIVGAIILIPKFTSGREVRKDNYAEESKTAYDYDDKKIKNKDDKIDSGSQISFDANKNYIFPSDSKYLSEEQLYGLTQDEVALLRNEIYARHGYVFNNEKFRTYFMNKSWYKPNDSFSEALFNSIEKANKDLIVEYEIEMGWR